MLTAIKTSYQEEHAMDNTMRKAQVALVFVEKVGRHMCLECGSPKLDMGSIQSMILDIGTAACCESEALARYAESFDSGCPNVDALVEGIAKLPVIE